ncbi:MarR family transcriptional regulator [Priestia aryabhattai]|uniref:MarR family winged helix-turn-helix transcriptional regulator n=1 Tax=Bacillaceae TaxID=186817 RepID=UPI000BA03AF6|nr:MULTISPECIES: MarR family transcriptional regulator [Bacillaceae]MDT2046873.1 MarR family transcriptional regulator [Priestia flexa]OZT14523.1 MarR family transcriptional regulator [Priestia aryabhattai]TDB54664.1 MarR family transcriptional regulator [Bacillus sp. CBEL-1]USY56987.1 MarR family transcriptional regulator [Bacillus sp. 1780r2a1]
MTQYNKENVKEQLESIDQIKEALVKYRNTVIGEKYDLLPYHLTPTKETILKTVYDKESCIVSDITKVLGLSPGAITIVLNQLEDEQLVTRIYKKKNRRSVWIELTEKGKNVVETLQKTRTDFWVNILSNLTDEERSQYIHIMQKLSKTLSE